MEILYDIIAFGPYAERKARARKMAREQLKQENGGGRIKKKDVDQRMNEILHKPKKVKPKTPKTPKVNQNAVKPRPTNRNRGRR